MTGIMYVDAASYRLLSFDGKINNAYQTVEFSRLPSHIEYHIDYDYRSGYASVSKIHIQGGNDMLKYRTVVFKVDDADSLLAQKGYMESNLIPAINEIGFDPALWERYDILKRTEKEEQMFKNQ